MARRATRSTWAHRVLCWLTLSWPTLGWPNAGLADAGRPSWRRVVLKLSGQAFAGGEALGISPDVVVHLAREITAAVREGFQIAVVVGGGNMFRGAALSREESTARARTTWACSVR